MVLKAKLSDLFILRNECFNDGVFGVTYSGKILHGAVLTTTHQNEDDCEAACLIDNRCKSINVNAGDGYGCELNGKIVGDNGTNFVKREGWNYKSTNFTAKKVND